MNRGLIEERGAQEELRRSEEFELLVRSVKDYAILMLDPRGPRCKLERGSRADQRLPRQ